MTLSIDHEGLRLLATMEEPLSLDHLKKIAALNAPLIQFLKPFATDDFYHRKWDFDGDATIDDFWTFDADATATGFAVPSPQQLGGVVTGSTGATDNGALSMFGTPVVKGDNVAIMKARFKVDEVDNLEFEIGFANAITDKTLPAVGDIDTPANGSNGAADIAVVKMDTDQTLKTMSFVVDGSTTGMDCQKSDLGVLTPTADTYMKIMVAVYGDNALCIVNGERAYRKVISNCIEGGTLLAPWLYFRCRAGTDAKAPTVDFVEVMGGR